MSSDLISRIKTARKELDAIKAGFTSGQYQWEEATVTTQTFDVTYSAPLVVTVTFDLPDFPILFTRATYPDDPPGVEVINLAMRKNLYEWHIHNFGVSVHQQIECTLLSWRTPATFTIGAE